MTEYLLYATGSAKPIENAVMTFMVTTSPQPMFRYFLIGLCLGWVSALLIILFNNLIWEFYDRLLEKRSSGKRADVYKEFNVRDKDRSREVQTPGVEEG